LSFGLALGLSLGAALGLTPGRELGNIGLFIAIRLVLFFKVLRCTPDEQRSGQCGQCRGGRRLSAAASLPEAVKILTLTIEFSAGSQGAEMDEGILLLPVSRRGASFVRASIALRGAGSLNVANLSRAVARAMSKFLTDVAEEDVRVTSIQADGSQPGRRLSAERQERPGHTRVEERRSAADAGVGQWALRRALAAPNRTRLVHVEVNTPDHDAQYQVYSRLREARDDEASAHSFAGSFKAAFKELSLEVGQDFQASIAWLEEPAVPTQSPAPQPGPRSSSSGLAPAAAAPTGNAMGWEVGGPLIAFSVVMVACCAACCFCFVKLYQRTRVHPINAGGGKKPAPPAGPAGPMPAPFVSPSPLPTA